MFTLIQLLLVFAGLYSVNGRVLNFPIYKIGHLYELVTYQRFPSIESLMAHYSKTGFLTRDLFPVKLTNQLIPDK